jgi:hypothetical protein
MKRIAALVVAMTVAGTAARAQTPAVHFPVAGTVINIAPVFWLRDDVRTSLILLQAGTVVTVVGRTRPWYKVVFRTDTGEQVGYMSPEDIRLDPDAPIPAGSAAERFSERGFVEVRAFGFPEAATNDDERGVGDVLAREELFAKPARWLQFGAGVDMRSSSHDQVDRDWHLDVDDRTVLRPQLGLRRLSAAINTEHVTLTAGKQFIRWGMADVLSPTDRFAPRDYLDVINNEILPVTGVRAALHAGSETLEAVWLPRMTPSRLPLLAQRWAIVPAVANGYTFEDNGSAFSSRPQRGARWTHVGRFELGVSVFDGVNHLPDIQQTLDPDRGVIALTRTYPALRTFGAESTVPTRVVTVKGEAAYFTSPTKTDTEYVLYVIEAERQAGEWLFDVGYAGEVVTELRENLAFDAERGMARSVIGRAAYTVDPRRTVAVEGAVRQNGHGLYIKGEITQAFGQHWRATFAGVGLRGDAGDFFGQYERNSYGSVTLRLSF